MYGSLSGLACLCFNFHRKGCTFDQKTNTVSIIIYKGPYNLKFHLSDQPLTLSLVPWAWTAWKFWLLPVWRSHISPLRFWVNLSLIALFFTRQKIFRPLRKYFHQKLADFRCEDLFFCDVSFALSVFMSIFGVDDKTTECNTPSDSTHLPQTRNWSNFIFFCMTWNITISPIFSFCILVCCFCYYAEEFQAFESIFLSQIDRFRLWKVCFEQDCLCFRCWCQRPTWDDTFKIEKYSLL